jgi:hypothetical protein
MHASISFIVFATATQQLLLAEYRRRFPEKIPNKRASSQFTGICEKPGSFQQLLVQIVPERNA